MGMPTYIAGMREEAKSRAQEWLTGQSVGTKLPARSDVAKLQLLEVRLDKPMPLVYGRHLVAGAPIIQDKDGSDNTFWCLANGEGPWDAIEYAWLDGALLTLPDYDLLHFHPGLDGQTGTETVPATENQKTCSLWPVGFTAIPFSRTCYTSMFFPLDPAAPGPDHDFRAIYRSRRMRIFDDEGTQTAFEYSSNPAWCDLDAYITLKLKPHGAVNEALSDEEKARIDFATYYASAQTCDYDIGGGVKRFESHVAFLDKTNLSTVFSTFEALCRGYHTERGGKLGLNIDQPRSRVYLFTWDEIAEHRLTFSEKDMRSLANRIVIKARDISSGGASPENDFAPWSKAVNDEAHQNLVGTIVEKEMDLGANTPERCDRLATYWLKRSLLPGLANLQGDRDAGMVMPGDIVNAPQDQRTKVAIEIDPDIISSATIGFIDPEKVSDGELTQMAWSYPINTNPTWLEFDFGAGNEQEILRWKLWNLIGPDASKLQYSDNDADWTDVSTLGYDVDYDYLNEASWDSVGAHRYWRILRVYKFAPHSTSFSEVQFYGPGKAWEVIEAADYPDGVTREFFLQDYDPAIFSDTADAQQDVEETNVA